MTPPIKVLTRLLKQGKIDLLSISLEQIDDLIKSEYQKQEDKFLSEIKIPYEPASFSVGFHHDWDSLMFWQPMNWRDFTLVYFNIETNCYSKYLELDLALLGFHLSIDLFRPIGNKKDR